MKYRLTRRIESRVGESCAHGWSFGGEVVTCLTLSICRCPRLRLYSKVTGDEACLSDFVCCHEYLATNSTSSLTYMLREWFQGYAVQQTHNAISNELVGIWKSVNNDAYRESLVLSRCSVVRRVTSVIVQSIFFRSRMRIGASAGSQFFF